MKTFLFIVLIIISFIDSSAQSVKLKTGGSYDILLKSYTTVNKNSPYEQEVENLSFSSFYNSTVGFLFDASFYFWSYQRNRSTGILFIGFNFEKSGISTSQEPVKYILGENISQNKYSPYLGYGNYLNLGQSHFMYGYLGVSIKNYEGKATIPAYHLEGTSSMSVRYFYKDIVALRIGAGIDFEGIGDSQFFISINSYFDWGVVRRGNGEAIYEGEKLIITPEGENSINDNTLYFSFTVGYKFDFSSE